MHDRLSMFDSRDLARARRGSRIDTSISLGILLLTAVLVVLTLMLVWPDAGASRKPVIDSRIIDAPEHALDVRVIVRPPAGRRANDFIVKPLGFPGKLTDAWGECSFESRCRGNSADLFDAAGAFLGTVMLPSAGHLEVRVSSVPPSGDSGR